VRPRSYLPAINRPTIINRSEEATNAVVSRAAPWYSTLAPNESIDRRRECGESAAALLCGISSINSTEVPVRVTHPRSYRAAAAHIRLAKQRESEARDDSAAGNYLLAIATGKQTRASLLRVTPWSRVIAIACRTRCVP